MNRSVAIPVAGAAVLVAGITAAVLSDTSGTSAGFDGGGTQVDAGPVYTLPDGGPWDLAPDASVSAGCNGSVCEVATGTGYVEYAELADGGLGAQQPFSCICASGAGACAFSDGGAVPLTGTYNPTTWGAMSGPGCIQRPCLERAGWTGAPQGCAP